MRPFLACTLTVFLALPYAAHGQSPTQAQELRTDEIYAKALPSVMTLVVDGRDGSQSFGTAFFAIKDGLAVTAYHVIEGAKSVTAKFSSGETFQVSGMVDSDAKRDLALIRVKAFGKPVLATSPQDPAIGSKACVLGAPMGLDFAVSDGIISQVRDMDGVKQIQFTCPASPGNSGGPLLNARGEAIGVVAWQIKDTQNLNFAVPIAYALGLDPSLPTTPWDKVRFEKAHEGTGSALTEEEINRKLADAVLLHVEARTESREIFLGDLKGDQFRFGISPRSYEIGQRLADTKASLSALSFGDPLRESCRKDLIALLDADIDALGLLVLAIREAQTDKGWSARAKDSVNRFVATMNTEPNSEAFPKLLAQPEFQKLFPPIYLEWQGLVPPSYGFRLGVSTELSDTLRIVEVQKGSVADQIGLKGLERVELFDGKKPADLLELKSWIKNSAGKTVKIRVQPRRGKARDIRAKIPEKLDGQGG